jgi:hypothetical protein
MGFDIFVIDKKRLEKPERHKVSSGVTIEEG